MILFRPVGLKELELILETNAQKFPPRLSWQPIFYPVLHFEYARQIAFEWNIHDAGSGYAGFVTEFDIENEYISQFAIQTVGNAIHQELWIPAEELENFNNHIQGKIRVTAAFFHPEYYKGASLSEFTSHHPEIFQSW
jgi:pterin-4a-carbinolamine dehydratase